MNEENVTVNGAGTQDDTAEQVEAMFGALENKVADVKAKFSTKKQDNTSFSFGTHAEMVIWCSELTITNAFSDIINKICDWK